MTATAPRPTLLGPVDPDPTDTRQPLPELPHRMRHVAVEPVGQGGWVFHPATPDASPDPGPPPPGLSRVTPRQVEMLQAVADHGGSLADLATRLGVHHDTVKSTLARAYRNLEVQDRAGAVAVGMRHGLIR